MKRTDSVFLTFRRGAILLSGLLLVVFGSFYFFKVSAQTKETAEKTETTQTMVNGRLAFSSQVFGPTIPEARILTSNEDGSGMSSVPLPQPPFGSDPAWSPDGTKLVFAWNQTPYDLYVTTLDGNRVNITNTPNNRETSPSWSFTGKIAYERDAHTANVQIWVINPDGTGNAQFTGITQPFPLTPSWSPDGTKLAFSSNGEIWVINADGTNEHRVTTSASDDRLPSWSPDGSKIVFAKGGNSIAVINADGTNETPISNNGTHPTWSPDGTKIAFSRDGIYTMNPDGSNQVRIVANVILFPQCCDTHYLFPSWQPVAQTPNTYSITGRITYNNLPVSGATVNLSGTATATTTTDAVGNYQFPNLTPGGNYTVTPSFENYLFTPATRSFNNLSSNQSGNFEVQAVCIGGSSTNCVKNGKVAFVYNNDIHTVNPDGTGQVNITNRTGTDGDPNFSPFGSNIIFFTNRDGNNEIYRMNADGTNPVRLTNNPASETSPFYSPDGASIVFTSTRDGNSEIYRMNADGTNQTRLTNEPAEDIYPAVSPDGQKIVFISRRLGSEKIFSMNFDGTNQQMLSEGGTFSPCYDRPSYSPDGTKIIFSFSPDCGTTHKSNWTINADGTNRTQAGLGRFATYSADGTKRAYVCCYFDPGQNPARLRVLSSSGEMTLSQNVLNFDEASPSWQRLPLTRRTPFDYDGDGRADISVFRPSENKWYILQSSTTFLRENIFGLAGDVPVPADYDGDGKTDIAIWRPSAGAWWYLSSINGQQVNVNFGASGDVPRPSDFDGDGKTDFVLYRPSNSVWYRMSATGQVLAPFAFGIAEDKPLIGDFDGDGRSDPAIFRPSTGDWWYAPSNATDGHFAVVHWGAAGDIPTPADVDADGKTDFMVYRPSNGGWYILRSGEQNYTILQFGLPDDKPVVADYDGDGKGDVAVFRPSTGTWYLLQTTSGFGAVQWGNSSDIPSENAFNQ